MSWIGEVDEIKQDAEDHDVYYVVLRVLYTARDLSLGVQYTEHAAGDAAALTGKKQLIRSNAMVRCYSTDILEVIHVARMTLDAANFPFVDPTQFWLREDIAVNTANEKPLSDEPVAIQVSRRFCHGDCAKQGLYLPERETARFCPECAHWFHSECLGTPLGTVQGLRSGDNGFKLPSWITWPGPQCNPALVDHTTVGEAVSMITLPIERGNNDGTLPGSPQWAVSLESFLISLRNDLVAGRYAFSFAEPSWSNHLEDRLAGCVVPPGDDDTLTAAMSYLNVATNNPLSERKVYLCPFDDTHYI
ncbi:hypothetical protein OH76DRAFT_1490743 [Lentinus brumalis]|uniref:Uncharacterized protein n=1 Tax=Lentinus brumalis TaxID=2498619 RepID=A0A371CHY8_9APHY|nr:hypothetical protein OH76DRAFT_1490743 [Polyporus brumalis]